MKYVEVQILSKVKFEKDTELADEPFEGAFKCLKTDGKYYLPAMVWLQYDAKEESWVGIADDGKVVTPYAIGEDYRELTDEEIEEIDNM